MFQSLSLWKLGFWNVYSEKMQKYAYKFRRVCQSVPMWRLEKSWLHFNEISYWEVLLIFVYTFQFWLKLNNSNGQFTLRSTCASAWILNETHKIFTRMKNVWRNVVVRNETHVYVQYTSSASPTDFKMIKGSKHTKIVTLCLHFLTCLHY
jgi:hypothetical protein